MIEQTRFLGAVFLCSEFKLENIYSGVNFCRKMFAVIFFAATYFCGSLEKPQKLQKLEPAKIFVPDVILNKLIIIKMDYYYFCFVRV